MGVCDAHVCNVCAGAIIDHSQSAKEIDPYFKSQLYVDSGHRKPVLILPNWLSKPGERAHDTIKFLPWVGSNQQPLDRQSNVLPLNHHRLYFRFILKHWFRRTNLPSAKMELIQHERRRHQVYCSKEASYWNRQFIEQSKQPKKLWRYMATLLYANTGKNQNQNQPQAEDLLSFFSSEGESVRQATEGIPAESNLPPSPVIFDSFEQYSADRIGKTISATPTKSWSMDPLPKYIRHFYFITIFYSVLSKRNYWHKQTKWANVSYW